MMRTSRAATGPGRRRIAGALLALTLGTACAPGVGIAVAADTGPAATTGAPPVTDSIYHLSIPLTDQDGREFDLRARRGRPMLISMFYTTCQFVCPMLIDTLRQTENALTATERAGLPVLLVSVDPARDTVAVLKRKAEERHLDGARWTLARTDERSVRRLAATLGIQYRALPNGDFNHSAAMLLIDAEGRIVGRNARLGEADADFVRLAKEALGEPVAR